MDSTEHKTNSFFSVLMPALTAGAHPEIFKEAVNFSKTNQYPIYLTINENARYHCQTGFCGNSCILLEQLFIQKPSNNNFESDWL